MLEQIKLNALRAKPVARQYLLIDGKHVAASDEAFLQCLSPIDSPELTHVPKTCNLMICVAPRL